MKVGIEITDEMIEKTIEKMIEKTVRNKLDEYFGKEAWSQYGNYNRVLERIVSQRVDELFTVEHIKKVIDEKKDYIAECVAEKFAEKIRDSICSGLW